MKRVVRERGWKPGLGQGQQLKLAVAVGEHGEHEETEPIVDRLVEGAQDARSIGVTAAARQRILGLLAAVAAEEAVEQVHHGPQVSALFHVYLEEQ